MQLVFATNNLNKINEVQALMPCSIKLLSLKDIGCFEDIPETQDTIKGNAIQKAEYIKQHYGYDCFADDTGLEAEELNNEPGVYSARYAGEQRDAEDNMNLLLKNLSGKANRKAQFKTVIALHLNGELKTFAGICKGEITKLKKDSINGEVKLLYVAPESLTKVENVEFLKKVNISFVAIDEAHCISEWGHDFRPEYRRIRDIISQLGELPLIALTATATPKVQQDIVKNLNMEGSDIFLSSFNRSNLYY